MSVIVLSLLLAFTSATPVEKISHLSEIVRDVTSSSAPAYWNAECGGRTYVGSYTLMMDWAECRDYCQYFPTLENWDTPSPSLIFWTVRPWSAWGSTWTPSTPPVMDMLATTGLEDTGEKMVSTNGTLELLLNSLTLSTNLEKSPTFIWLLATTTKGTLRVTEVTGTMDVCARVYD